jgi:hypothetical protein
VRDFHAVFIHSDSPGLGKIPLSARKPPPVG